MRKLIATLLVAGMLTPSAFAAQKNVNVVEVGKVKITEKDIETVLQENQGSNATPMEAAKFLVKQALLYQEALKEGLQNDPEVKEQLKLLRRQTLALALLKKKFGNMDFTPTEKEIKEFYEENKSNFKTKDGKILPLSVVKPFIVSTLEQRKRIEAINNYLESLLKKYKIKVLKKKAMGEPKK